MRLWSCGLLSAASMLCAGCVDASERLPIPPIDAAAPAVTETATFALG